MQRKAKHFLLLAILTVAVAGCQSHEAKVAKLQKDYDRLGMQFRRDCAAEMLDLPKKLSSKCDAEDKNLGEAWSRLQAMRFK